MSTFTSMFFQRMTILVIYKEFRFYYECYVYKMEWFWLSVKAMIYDLSICCVEEYLIWFKKLSFFKKKKKRHDCCCFQPHTVQQELIALPLASGVLETFYRAFSSLWACRTWRTKWEGAVVMLSYCWKFAEVVFSAEVEDNRQEGRNHKDASFLVVHQ